MITIAKVTCFDCLRWKFQYPSKILKDGLCLYCDTKACLYDVDRWGTLYDYVYLERVYIEYQRDRLELRLKSSGNGVITLAHEPCRTYDYSIFHTPPAIEGPAVRPRLDNIKRFAEVVSIRCTKHHKMFTHGREPMAGDGYSERTGMFYDICKYCYHRTELQEVVRHQYENGQYGWRVRDYNELFKYVYVER